MADLSKPQQRVLRLIADGSVWRQQYYPYRYQVARGTVSGRTVDSLRKRELVEVDHARTTSGVIPLKLTAAGRAILGEVA